jgi:hypothetical protein
MPPCGFVNETLDAEEEPPPPPLEIAVLIAEKAAYAVVTFA